VARRTKKYGRNCLRIWASLQRQKTDRVRLCSLIPGWRFRDIPSSSGNGVWVPAGPVFARKCSFKMAHKKLGHGQVQDRALPVGRTRRDSAKQSPHPPEFRGLQFTFQDLVQTRCESAVMRYRRALLIHVQRSSGFPTRAGSAG